MSKAMSTYELLLYLHILDVFGLSLPPASSPRSAFALLFLY